ncbi:ALKBH7 [Symbiodinium sp. CCMP2456]|nr:ALKBH7 [Symbiodinium sp. CCMP2456]
MSDRSMSRPRLYKDTPGPPAAWQKRRAVSLPRSQPERSEGQDWDSGSQHAWREHSNGSWSWKTGGWDDQNDSQGHDWNYSVTGLMGRWTKTVGADWGWERQRGDWSRDSGYKSWGAAQNAGEASGQKRKLEPHNEEAAGTGVMLQVVDGVPVVSLERGSDMDSNAAPLLQAALENHARAESLYEQCDSAPEAVWGSGLSWLEQNRCFNKLRPVMRALAEVKKVADIGIARAAAPAQRGHEPVYLEVLLAAAHWAHGLMRGSLIAWGAAARRQLSLRIRARRLGEERLVPALRRRALERWQFAARAEAQRRRAAPRRGRQLLATVIGGWRQGTRLEQWLRCLRKKQRLRRTKAAVRWWSSQADLLARRRRTASAVRSRVQANRCEKVVTAWRQYVAVALRLKRHVQKRNLAILEQFLLHWRELCSAQLWRRTRLEERLMKRRLRPLLGAWQWHVLAEACLRARVSHRSQALVLQSFGSWLRSTARVRRCRQMEAQQHLKAVPVLRETWRAWHLQQGRGHAARLHWRRAYLQVQVEATQCSLLQQLAWKCWRESAAITREMLSKFRRRQASFCAPVLRAWRGQSRHETLADAGEDVEASDCLEVSASTAEATEANSTLRDFHPQTGCEISAFEISTSLSEIRVVSPTASDSKHSDKEAREPASLELEILETGPELKNLPPVPPWPPKHPVEASTPLRSILRSVPSPSRSRSASLASDDSKRGTPEADSSNSLRIGNLGAVPQWPCAAMQQAAKSQRRASQTGILRRCALVLAMKHWQAFRRGCHQLRLAWRAWRMELQDGIDARPGRALHDDRLLCRAFNCLRPPKQSAELRRQLALQAALLLQSVLRRWRQRCEDVQRAGTVLRAAASKWRLGLCWIPWCELARGAEKLPAVSWEISAISTDSGSALERSRASQRSEGPGRGSSCSELFVETRMRQVSRVAAGLRLRAAAGARHLAQLLRAWSQVLRAKRFDMRKAARQRKDALHSLLCWQSATRLFRRLRRLTLERRYLLLQGSFTTWWQRRGWRLAVSQLWHAAEQRVLRKAACCWRQHFLAGQLRLSGFLAVERKAAGWKAWCLAVRILRGQRRAKRLFFFWRAKLQAARRCKLRRCVRVWVGCSRGRGTLARSAFRSWRALFCGAQQRRLELCYEGWRQHHQAFKQASTLALVARTRRCHVAWKAWRRLLRLRDAWNAARELRGGSRARQALASWHRALRHRAICCLEKKQLGHASLQLWRCAAHVEHRERAIMRAALASWIAAVSRVQTRRLGLSLRAWRHWAWSRSKLRSQLQLWNLFRTKSRQQRLSLRLRRWSFLAKAGASDRQHLAQLLRAWMRECSLTADLVRETALRRLLLAWRCVPWRSRAAGRLLAAALAGWRSAALLGRATRDRQLQRCIRLWQAATAERQVLDMAWVAWQLFHSSLCLLRLRRCFWLWRRQKAWRSEGGVVKQVVASWRQRASLATATLPLRAWHGLLCRRRRWRPFGAGLLQRWRSATFEARGLKRKVLAAWKRSLQLARRCRLRKALTAWHFAQMQRRQRLQLAEAVLCSWANAVDARKSFAVRMRHFWRCCERSLVLAAEANARVAARCLSAWRHRSLRRSERCRRHAAALQAIRLQPLRRAFRGLHAACRYQGQQRQLVQVLNNLTQLAAGHLRCAFARLCVPGRVAARVRDVALARQSLAWEVLVENISTSQRHKAGLFRLQQLMLLRGFLALLAGPRRARHQAAERESRVEGLRHRSLERLALLFLLAWNRAAKRSCLSDYLLRWRRSAAISRACRSDEDFAGAPREVWRRWACRAVQGNGCTTFSTSFARLAGTASLMLIDLHRIEDGALHRAGAVWRALCTFAVLLGDIETEFLQAPAFFVSRQLRSSEGLAASLRPLGRGKALRLSPPLGTTGASVLCGHVDATASSGHRSAELHSAVAQRAESRPASVRFSSLAAKASTAQAWERQPHAVTPAVASGQEWDCLERSGKDEMESFGIFPGLPAGEYGWDACEGFQGLMNVRVPPQQFDPAGMVQLRDGIAKASRLPQLQGHSLRLRPCVSAAPLWPRAVYGHRFKLPQKLPQGLRYCADFISEAEERELDQLLSTGPWLRHIKSRAQQFFGLVYYQTTQQLPALQPSELSAQNEARSMEDLPEWLMQRVLATGAFPREGEINQVAANEYLERVGTCTEEEAFLHPIRQLTGVICQCMTARRCISSHMEEPTAFGRNLGTLSMLSPVQMTLTPAEEDLHGRDGLDHGNWVKILLEPRSFLLLQGESRYEYRHGIRRSKLVQLGDGQILRREAGYRRVSLTFRELLQSRRQLSDTATDGKEIRWISRREEN